MGLDCTVRFPAGATPSWDAIRSHLRQAGESGQLRMIDGLPAFPDEDPPADWKELRVGTAGGMVTVRRGAGVLSCVVWGTADPNLDAGWRAVTWACAAAGNGVVATPTGDLDPAAFARLHNLSTS